MFKKKRNTGSKYGKSGIKKQHVWGIWDYRQELGGVFLVALFAFLSVSFFSYSPTDNSWFYFSSANKEVANWCGVVGAHVASLFFFLLGSGSFMLLFCLFTFVLFLFFPKLVRGSRVVSLGALPVVLLISTLLFRMHVFDFVAHEPGGMIGRLLETVFVAIFGRAGSFVVLYSAAWICFLLLAQISIINFVTTVGAIALRVSTITARVSWIGLRNSIFFCSKMSAYVGRLISFVWMAWFSRFKKDKTPVYIAQERMTQSGQSTSQEELLLRELRSLAGAKESNAAPITAIQPKDQGVSSAGAQVIHSEPEVSIAYDLPNFSDFQEIRESTDDQAAFEKKCRERGQKLEEKLLHFGVKGKVVAIRPGPVVTLFEYRPEIDSKISKIISLEDDLAMALTALSIRIIAPIPGRNVIGFEISNQTRQDVFLSDVLADSSQDDLSLPLAFGVDITGNPVTQDLTKMPHILVAGSTGSGKSVGLNAMLISLLCRLTPADLKIILIDPKRLEFAPYADIPHLLFPIVTNPRKAIPILKWVVQEMEDRYDIMARVGARSIFDYHKWQGKTMPFIVVIIDELADLMMVAGKDVETQIARTAQMARAAGIHMIVATQRPSVDVLTGIIKVNFPARIAFRVSSKIDSRTIIDSQGAEKLLGRGDMLFLNSGSSAPQRIHGAYVSGAEISRLTEYLREQQQVEYLDVNEELRRTTKSGMQSFEDNLYDQIREFVETVDEISISMLQRKYRIGFNRSARIIEQLELDGVIAPSQGGKTRKVIHDVG